MDNPPIDNFNQWAVGQDYLPNSESPGCKNNLLGAGGR